MAKVEFRDGLYSLAFDSSNREGWQSPWGIAPEKCFSQPGPMTPNEALAMCRAGFNVESKPFALGYEHDGEMHTTDAPGYAAQIRTDLGKVLGITGDRYEPVQYSRVLGLLDGTSFRIDAAAVLDGGEGFYSQARLGRDPVQTPKGPDYVDTYLTLRASHDGSTGILAGWSTTRIVCANTLSRATVDTYRSIGQQEEGAGKAKHTKNVGDKLLDMARAIKRVDEARQSQLALYGKLARTQVTGELVKGVVAAAFPNKLLDGTDSANVTGATRTQNVRNRVLEIFETGAFNTPRDRSAWSLWQAVTAYMSHESGVRGVTGGEAQTQRWLRATLEGNEPSERALKFLTVSAQ